MSVIVIAFVRSFQTIFRVIPDTYRIFFNTFKIIFSFLKISIQKIANFAKNGILLLHKIVSSIVFFSIRFSFLIFIIFMPAALYYDPYNLLLTFANTLGNPPWFTTAKNAVIIICGLFISIFLFNLVSMMIKYFNVRESQFDWKTYRDGVSDLVGWLFILAAFAYFVAIRVVYWAPSFSEPTKFIDQLKKGFFSSSNQIYLHNQCKEKIEIALLTQGPGGEWIKNCCWNIDGQKRIILHSRANLPLEVYGEEIYINAKSQSGMLLWSSVDLYDKKNVEFNRKYFTMYRLTKKSKRKGFYDVTLDCNLR